MKGCQTKCQKRKKRNIIYFSSIKFDNLSKVDINKFHYIYTASKLYNASLSSYGITVYQFTEYYIINANTVPMLILFFLNDFRGTWQADRQGLCGGLIRRCAACRLVHVTAPPTNRCQLNVNQGKIKHATHTACQVCALLWKVCSKLPLILSVFCRTFSATHEKQIQPYGCIRTKIKY